MEHQRTGNGEGHTQVGETTKEVHAASVCDVGGLYKHGLRRSARLKEKLELAAHSGRGAEELKRIGKRNWVVRKSRRRPVSEIPGAIKANEFKAARKANRGQRRSMDDVALGQTVANKLKALSSTGNSSHMKEQEGECDSSVEQSPDGPPQAKQKIVKSPFFGKKHCQMTKLAFKVKRHRHLLYPHFKPALSPIGLVQEKLYDNPWKLLVATIFLNRTTGALALPVLWKFFELFPDPNSVLTGNPLDIANLMQPLGLNNKRASIICRLSKEYLTKDWVYPEELHGIGKYGNDSYRIFCCGAEWQEVTPTDHKLNEYYEWLTKQHADGALVMNSSWYPAEEEGMS